MALIIKSNVRGALEHAPFVSDVTMTDAEYFDSYAASVVADGGDIVSTEAVENAIEWARSTHISLGGSAAVSASWGVKTATDGVTIRSLYGFNGDVFDAVGSPTLDTSGAFPKIKFGTRNEYFKQRIARRNIMSRRVALGLSGVGSNSSTRSCEFAITKGAIPDGTDFHVNAVGITAYGTNGSARESVFAGGSDPYDGLVGYWDHVNDVVTAIENGTPGNSSNSNAPFVDAQNYESTLQLGLRIYNDATYGSSNEAEFSEFWLVNDAAFNQAVALSGYLQSLYAL